MEQGGIIEIVRDLALVLADPEESAGIVPAYEGEDAPAALDFVFAPVVESPAPQTRVQEPKKTMPVIEPQAGPVTANAACRLCTGRMYPVRKFFRAGSGRVLFLYFNGAVEPGRVRPDRSDKHILGSAEEDDLLFRMLKAAGFSKEEISFQEFPACHFSADRSTPEEWTARAANCRTHLNASVEHHQIQRIVATGQAAFFLVGREKALAMAASGISHPVAVGDAKIPVTVVRSPAALLAMEKKRKSADPSSPGYAELVAEEKAVKDRILASLKAVRSAASAG